MLRYVKFARSTQGTGMKRVLRMYLSCKSTEP